MHIFAFAIFQNLLQPCLGCKSCHRIFPALWIAESHVSFMMVQGSMIKRQVWAALQGLCLIVIFHVLTVVQSDEEMLGGDTWKTDRLQRPDCRLSADDWRSVTLEIRWDTDSTSFERGSPRETKSPTSQEKKNITLQCSTLSIYSPSLTLWPQR